MSVKTWKVEDFKIRYLPATAYEEATYLVDYPDGDTHYRIRASEAEAMGLRVLLPTQPTLATAMLGGPEANHFEYSTLHIPPVMFLLAKAGPTGVDGPYSQPPTLARNATRAAEAFPNLLTRGACANLDSPKAAYPCDCRSRLGPGLAAATRPGPGLVADVIMHLNDYHTTSSEVVRRDRWSRERIADWLDELHNTGQVDLSIHWEEEKA